MTPAEDPVDRLAVERGLLRSDQVAAARAAWSAEPSPPSFLTYLVDRGFLTGPQAGELSQARSGAPAGDTVDCGPAKPSTPASPPSTKSAPTDRGKAPADTVACGPPKAPAAVHALDKYGVLHELGRGGMGIVYKAWHRGLNTHFAIKALLDADGASAEALLRFRKEAQALARLRHPGIVAVHDIWEESGRTYLAMEFVEGTALDRRLAAGPLPVPEAVRIAREIAEAIQYAHEQGVIHRDLKPANVFRLADGRIKVMDFGLAKMVDAGEAQVTRTGALMGTPAYMSPEQVDEGIKSIDGRSDVYQVGAILYEMLTGARPYRGDSEMEILLAVSRRDPLPPRRVNPKIGRNAETICLKAMAREKERRYPTARALAEDCRRFLEGDTILARRASLPERAVLWARRRKAIAGLAAAAAFAFLIAGAAAWKAHRAEGEKAHLEAELLQGLRTMARVNLDAALMVRRAGGSMAEARGKFLGPLLESARVAIEKAPQLAEPHYHVGRMYRALLRFDDARGEQELALTKDPECAPSRYERAVLNALRYGERLIELRQDWLRAEGRRLARRASGPAGPGPVGDRPPDDELAAADPAARDLCAAVLADLERLERDARPGEGSGSGSGVGGTPAFGAEPGPGNSGGKDAGPGAGSGSAADDAAGAELSPAHLVCARGMFLLFTGKREERARAREMLADAIARDRSLEEAHEGLARAALMDQDLDGAEAAYGRGLEADKGYVPFLTGRGDVRLHSGMATQRRGEDPSALYRAAAADYDAALALDDALARAWMARGILRTNEGEWAEEHGGDAGAHYTAAGANLDRATALDPASGQAWASRGTLHANWGNLESARGGDPESHYERADADYGRALERMPGWADIWSKRAGLRMNRATGLQQQGRDPEPLYAAARADCSEALERNPKLVEPWMVRGIVHSSLGVWRQGRGLDPSPEYEAALRDLGAAIELDPGFADLWAWRGGARQNWGYFLLLRAEDPGEQHTAAEKDLTQALTLKPKLARALLWRGDVRTHEGLWRHARGQDPTETYARAQEDYDAALAIDATSADAWLRRGMVRTNWGNWRTAAGADASPLYEGACGDFEKATGLNPRSVDAWLKLGDTRANWAVWLKAAGKDPRPLYPDAAAAYDAALKLNPGSAEAWAARGLLKSHWGQELQERGEDAAGLLGQAESDYAAALERNPNAAGTHLKRAMLRVTWAVGEEARGRDGSARYAEAFADFDRAVILAPGDAEAHWRRGWLHYARRHFAEAVADFEAAGKANPASEAIWGRMLKDAQRRLGGGGPEGK